jgi:hydrogenase maturation protease
MKQPRVLVLGIGNLLWADEGFGVRAVERMHLEYEFDDNVTLMDGGTQGLYLVQDVRAADILVVFDAVDYGLPPGTLKLVEDAEVPQFLGVRKMSLHQTGFQEVIATAAMFGEAPQHMLLVGVQPVELEDYGGSLRDDVKSQVEAAIGAALAYLARFGITARKRDQVLPPEQALATAQVSMDRYEGGRPTDAEACRSGDARVLAMATGSKR